MAITRDELLALQVNDNQYTRTFDFNSQAESGFGDAVTMGLAASIVSGGVGIINTGIAVGNMFGADTEQLKTEEVLQSWDWDDTYNYYSENKEIIDAVGFAVSTFVPGSLGIKAARYAQAAAKASQSRNLGAVALRKILVPDSITAKVQGQVLKDTMHVANRSQVTMQAAKQGIHQAAVETAFAETAIILSTNQHVTVNNNSLGYFEAIWEQKDGFMIGFGLGTGVGGLVGGAINARAANSLIEEAQKSQNRLFQGMQNLDSRSNRAGFVQGNKVAEVAARHKESVDKFASLEGAELKEFTRRERELRDDLFEEIAVLTDEVIGKKTPTGRKEVKGHLSGPILELVDRGSAEQVADTFRGAQKVGKFNDQDFLFDPAAQPLSIAGSADEYKDMIGASMYGSEWTKPTKDMIKAVDEAAKDSAGVSIYAEDSVRFRENFINKALIEGLGEVDEYNPSHLIGTIRHEVGHGNTVFLGSMFEAKGFQIYRDEMFKLSRKQRPSSWERYDVAKKNVNTLLAQASRSVEDMEVLAKNQEWIDYLEDPMELMADSWAQFNAKDPALRTIANEIGVNTRTFMEQNSALKTRLGKTEKLLALKSGKLYDEAQWAPTLADRGTPRLSGNTVTAGDIGVKIDGDKFSILSTTPDEASAYYFAASQTGKKLTKEVNTNWDNFYTLNRLHKGLADGTWSGKVNVKLEDGTIRSLDGTLDDIADNFDTMFTDFKTIAADKLNKRELNKRNNTYSDIGRMIDTDEDFAMSIGNDTKSQRFWTRENDPTKPTVAKVFYQTGTDETGAGTSALTDAVNQNQKVYEVNDEMINSFFGELDKVAGEGVTQSRLNLIAPEPSWKVGGQGDMADISAHSQLTGAFKTFHGQFGESTSKGQAIGKFNELAKLKGNEAIQRSLSNVAQRLESDTAAVMELNVLDSKLRQQFYKFSPKLDTPEQAVQFLAQKVDQVPPEQGALNAQRLMESTTGQKMMRMLGEKNNIWSRDVEQLVTKIVNQKKFQQSNLQKLDQMLEQNIIPIKNQSVVDFWKAKVESNGMIVDGKRTAGAARGYASTLDPEVLYPGGLNTTKYKHRKYVVPLGEEVWSHNQKGIIGASSPAELAQKEAQVKQQFGNKVKIVSKEEMESQFAKNGEFLEEYSLSEYQVNRDLARRGVNWDVAPEANPALVSHYIRDMAKDWAGTVDNLTELKYAEEFASLQQMDDVSQQFGTLGAGRQELVDTPFREMQNIMLNRTNTESGKSWRDAQQAIDKTISKVFGGLTGALRGAEKSGNYEDMSKYMDHYGLPKVYSGQVGDMLRTSTQMSDQALKELVPKVNGIAATLMLRLDFVQPMVNALSMPIMSVPEMSALMKSVPTLKAQQMRKGLQVTVPDTNYTMGTNMKLQMQAVKDFFTEDGKALLKKYYDEGIITNIVREMRQVADDITIDTSLATASIAAKVDNAASKVVNKLARPADWAEDFVKFVAARQADLLMDAAGITDQSIRSATLRTYTTRVHGNYVSAQRPAVFQGFAGQAIGLFQTYQFNLIQSLLGKIGNKEVKAVGAMMGIQAGMFGVQSVPGFRALNDYIASNSDEGTDFYTGLADTTGQEESEWLLYGMSSNFTKPIFGEGLELYTRGDLNPRTPFLIPTSLAEVPIWSLSSKFVGSLLGAASDLSQGVDAGQVMADTLAHNGVNRPLAGVGAILSGVRTTSNGSLIASLSDISWFAKAARVAGTKTLDESIAVQSFYRTKGYDAKRTEEIQDLGRGVKRMIQADQYDNETYTGFMQEYTARGGRAEKFNQWMHSQAIGASESSILKMYNSNDSTSGRYMQEVMGYDIDAYINPNL